MAATGAEHPTASTVATTTPPAAMTAWLATEEIPPSFTMLPSPPLPDSTRHSSFSSHCGPFALETNARVDQVQERRGEMATEQLQPGVHIHKLQAERAAAGRKKEKCVDDLPSSSSAAPHQYQLPFTMNLLIAMLALMPAGAVLMPPSIDDANTQPVATVAESQLDPAIQATTEVLHARTPPPADLSDLPTDLEVLVKMAKTYASIIQKATDRVMAVRNGHPSGPLSATEYIQMTQKYYEKIERIQDRVEQLSKARFSSAASTDQ
ncbi:hypothetical protein V8E36_007288 [Tilletia maclaganii]